MAKDYINKNFPYIKTAKTLFRTKNPEDLRNFNFPDNFVLKNSSGAKMNIIVKNKKYNIDYLIKKSKEFLSTQYSITSYRKIPFFNAKEVHYDYNEPTIFIEEYLDENIQDFKFFNFREKVSFIQIDNERFKNHQRNLYNEDMKKLKYKVNFLNNFEEKIKLSENNLLTCKKFCKDFFDKEKFDFVRIDFYIYKNQVYFGEFTFTPGNCMEKYSDNFEKLIYDKYIKNYYYRRLS